MNQIFKNFQSLGAARIAMIGATVLTVVIGLIVGMSYVMAPQYRALSTDMSASQAAQVVSSLESAGFRPRISTDGTLVSLPEGDIARARMALAESGIPAAGAAGWEIFDNSNGIGMNSFLQRVNRSRALEGELARSVRTIESVEDARVHLVLPERESFSQERPEPTASVIVRTRGGFPMERRQAVAIRNLVASAVPSLSPSNVVVLSSTGETILGDETVDSQAGLVNARAALEDRVARNIENIISAHVGAGNVRVRVAADINTDREVVVSQTFDPDQQVARSTSSLSEQSESSDADSGNVDVANNLAGVDNGNGAGGGSSDSRNKTLDETVFEIGNTRSERITEAGGVRRLSVAVIVNGRMEDGQYSERTADEMTRIDGLVRTAAGVSEERGDEVTVESLRFVEGPELLGETESGGMSDIMANNASTIIKGLILIVALLILAFGIRPIVARARGNAEEGEMHPEAPVQDAVPEIEEKGAETVRAGADESGDDEYVSLTSVSGNVMKRYIEELSAMIQNDEEEALRTIRSWIKDRG